MRLHVHGGNYYLLSVVPTLSNKEVKHENEAMQLSTKCMVKSCGLDSIIAILHEAATYFSSYVAGGEYCKYQLSNNNVQSPICFYRQFLANRQNKFCQCFILYGSCVQFYSCNSNVL